MRTKLFTLIVAVVSVLTMPALAGAKPEGMPRLQAEPSLLQNSDLEGGGEVWPFQDGIAEVQVAPGWRGYYVDAPPAYVKRPAFCIEEDTLKKKDDGCFWARPEFRDVMKRDQPNRVHGGQRAQKYFTYGRMHEAGLLQRVTGVMAGTQYRFSIYMQTWMCTDFDNRCKGGYVSDTPTTMHLRVGIDPTGGINPFSPNIVWSSEVDSFDRWTQYSVEAVAKGDVITVFTHSRPEWFETRPVNNDVYIDDASLSAVGAPAPTAQPTSGAASQSAPAATPTPPPASFAVKPQSQRTSGALFHTVQPNDTLFGIALAYGVTVDEIVQLNNIKPGDFLQLGQELIIKGAANPPAATVLPTIRATTPPTPRQPIGTPAATLPTPIAEALSPGNLCVQAFNDRNANGVLDQNEGLVAGVKFSVLASTDSVVSYTTTGADEPYCFRDLAPRAYTLRAELPQDYTATTDTRIGIALAAGRTVNYSFGTRSNVEARSAAGQSNSWLSRDGGTFLGIGIGVLLSVGVIIFLFVYRRK